MEIFSEIQVKMVVLVMVFGSQKSVTLLSHFTLCSRRNYL